MSALAAGVLLTSIAVGALAPIIRAAPSDTVSDKGVKTAQAGAVPPAGQPQASPAAKVNADRLAKAKADRAARAKIRKARSAAAAAKASSARKAAAAKKAAASKRALLARKKNGRKPVQTPRGPTRVALPPPSAPVMVATAGTAGKGPPPSAPAVGKDATAETAAAPPPVEVPRQVVAPMAQFQLPTLAGPSGGPPAPASTANAMSERARDEPASASPGGVCRSSIVPIQ